MGRFRSLAAKPAFQSPISEKCRRAGKRFTERNGQG
jgi:hypothetical protein